MSSSLFRKEALEHRKDRLFGDVVLLQPLSMTVLVSVVVFVCLMIMAILFWGTYARKETVQGYLVPDKGIVKTYAPQGGTIAKVHVREGDEVKEGDTLITMISERGMQGGSDIDSVQLKELAATQIHLTDRIKAEKSLHISETARLNNQIEGLKKELGQIEQSLHAQEDRLQIMQTRLNGAKKLLESKNLSQNDYQKIYEEMLVQKQQYQEMQRAKSTRENALSQAKSELEQLPIRTESLINDIENKISEIKQREAEVSIRRALEIRSPISGTVTALQVREGQAQTTNTPLLAIMPKDASLQVELFVPSRAIGFIAKDQRVKVRFAAFPYQRFGIYEGQVAVISKHVLLPSELPTAVIELKEPVYRLTVNLDKQYVNAYGTTFPLQAGMSLEADIILENQTLFQWILDPLTSLKGRMS